MLTRAGVAVAAALAMTGWLAAQEEPAFEVASVKVVNAPVDAGLFSSSITFTPSSFRIANLTLVRIADFAYHVDLRASKTRFDWSKVDRRVLSRAFDIEAKGEGVHKAMFRRLLRERFGLRVHTETRQVPVLALVVREQVGPWLKPSTINCWEQAMAGAFKKPGSRPPQCSSTNDTRNGATIRRDAGTIAELAAQAQVYFDVPVIDATGLSGNYEWELAISNARVESQAELSTRARDAFEDQLGLTFERRTSAWEVIVIDAIQMPTPN